MTGAHDHQALSRGLIRPLLMATAVIGAFMVVEVVGGVLSGSLALMSDAGHMLTDTLALVLSLAAVRVALRPPTEERTYGFHRAEILAALVNGSTLIVISVLIFYESARRFVDPPEVNSTLMLVVAVAGLVANAAAASLLRDRSRHNLNARGAYLHIMGDLLSSIGVIVGAVLMLAFGWWLADPVISVLIGVIILAGAWKLVTQATHILLESVPSHLTLEEVRQGLKDVDGVGEVHDLHVWTVASGLYAMSAHVVVEDARVSDYGSMMSRCREMLRERFGISHTTIQLECEGCEAPFCALSRDDSEDG